MWFEVLYALECVVVWVALVDCYEDGGSKFMRNVDKYLSNPDMRKQVSSKPSYPLATLQGVTTQPQSQFFSEANGFGISSPIKQASLKRYVERVLRQNTHVLVFTALTLLGLNEGLFRLRTTLNLYKPCVLYIGRAYLPDVAFYVYFFNKL
jgi:hypothetical protein